ncbi:MAG TPA: glycosyltransferase family 4 protein [Alphaproteobacteria bacterium]|nr:glycosyltransferase family 4 protein [Alphaproteobacteria bacterium]
MRILFLHQNCPGQYKHLAPLLAAHPGNEVAFITQPGKPELPGVKKLVYKPQREVSRSTHHYLRLFEAGVLAGQGAARAAMKLRSQGFVPDVICAHPGWGEALYIKDVFPRSPLVNYCEFYYHAKGADVGFDPAHKVTLDDQCRIRTKNALHLLSVESCDRGISPTRWQWSQFPKEFRDKIAVIHDGIDTGTVAPKDDARFHLPNGTVLTREQEVVTYVARNLEPYRGFPSFMRTAEVLCRRRPRCQILIVGSDGVSYGTRAPGGKSWRETLLGEVSIDPARVHFTGRLPYARYLEALQVSSAHVYLTYPFVLSWSMLEAMSAGCLVVGSDTPPVKEVIEDGKNGLLVDFFSGQAIAERVEEALDHRERMNKLRQRARSTVIERFELKDCLKRHLRLIEEVAGRPARPARAASGGRRTPGPARPR